MRAARIKITPVTTYRYSGTPLTNEEKKNAIPVAVITASVDPVTNAILPIRVLVRAATTGTLVRTSSIPVINLMKTPSKNA